jgi:Fic family protein
MSRYPALTRHKIPFEIKNTDAFVRMLMRIASAKPFLDESLGTPLEVKLHRKAKVRAITYSNQIEGNPLGEIEVTAVLNGKRIAGASNAVKEVQNYHAALDYVEKLSTDERNLKIPDFCDIQKLVTSGLIAERQWGRVRTVPVSIVNASTQEFIEQCPEPHALRELLDDLWKWLDDTEEINAFARAFAFHFIAVSIHPFVDGNGRSVRLMQHLLLLRGGETIARFVPSETVIMMHRDRYYSSIRQSREMNSLHPILEFLAECFAISAEEVVQEGKALLRESAGKTLAARHSKILKMAKDCDSFVMNDVIVLLPYVPLRTLERDLALLTKRRSLKASGSKKGRFYRLSGK